MSTTTSSRVLVPLAVIEPEPAGPKHRRPDPPTGPVRTASRRLRRPVYGLAGQVLNAATNVVTAFVASYLLRPDEFGSFVLAFAAVTMVLAAGRGLLGSAIVVHLPTLRPARAAGLVRSAAGFTVLVGVGVSVLMAAAAPFVGAVVLWFAPWLTVALAQDLGRYVFLAERRNGAALALDVAWALAQGLVVTAWLLLGGSLTVGLMATAWGIGAFAGLALFTLMADARPTAPAPWFRATRDVSGWFTGVAALGAAELFVVLALTGALLGAVDAGGLRAAQLLAYQPAMVVAGALIVMLTPGTVRARRTRASLRRAAGQLAAAQVPIVLGLVLVAALHAPLMALLFPRYTAFAPLVVPVALQSIVLVAAVPATVVLRALRRGRAVFLAQAVRIVALIGAAAIGATAGGTLGLAWALVVATAACAVQVSAQAYLTTRREVRR